MSDNSPQSPSWYRIAATNYVTVQLCLTLEDIGLFDELRKGPTTVTKLSDILRLRVVPNLQACGLNTEILGLVQAETKEEAERLAASRFNLRGAGAWAVLRDGAP